MQRNGTPLREENDTDRARQQQGQAQVAQAAAAGRAHDAYKVPDDLAARYAAAAADERR